ncbi:MAG TPA: VCBS repeat-containing protein [Verrucomicrobiae bacterium]|jgi:hypothetical protein|nr:VCBS repeat-containing protein [Verrucomicrobiae bacterium]
MLNDFLRGSSWKCALICLALASAARGADKPVFGFHGPEIFPIDNSISLLHVADLDGDGLNDIVVVNNARSKINLLYNRTGKTNVIETRGQKRELNELPPDARFRIDSISSEKRISSLVVADLNGDGRPDLAYYGDPKELVVQYNLGTNGWSAPKRWPIDDGQTTANALAVGDLNGDKRPDLILLGENNIYYLAQNADHTLAEPQKIPFSGVVRAVQAIDIDGDGRDDLLLINWDSANPFRFRLQNADGQLGPENYFQLPPIRSYIADDLDGDHKTEIITIAQNSGRAQISSFSKKPAETISGAVKQGQFSVLPMNRNSSGARRGELWADLNGDGLPDLLVAEPDSGQMTLYLQKPDGTLGAAKTFATLTGISELAAADWNNDGHVDIFVLSGSDAERQVGVTRLDTNGSIAFPTILPIDGTPKTMAVGPLRPGAKPTLAVIVEQDTNRSLVTIGADRKMTNQKLSGGLSWSIGSMKMHDLNQDGLMDLVVVVPGDKFKALIQHEGKTNLFEEQDIMPPGGSAAEPWVGAADIDADGKPELLLAEKNFVRAVVLTNETDRATNGKSLWSFHVKEQINGASSDSHIIGATSLRNGTNAAASIVLLDSGRKALTVCERDTAGVWQVVRNVTLPFSDFTSAQAIRLGSSNQNCVALMGANAIGTQALTGDVWELGELDSYETPIRDGHLSDLVVGDLNHDGRKDLVFFETAKNYLDLVTFEPPHQLVPATRWQVFEERTFRSRRNDSLEPREAAVADVTGDGKNDLIVLVHDRLLLYPQE